MDSGLARAFVEQAKHHLKGDFLPKLKACVSELSDEQLWWRPNENSNSVGNLLMHLSGNVRQWLIAGVGGEPDSRNRPLEFSQRDPLSKSELMVGLERTLDEAFEVLDSLTTEGLLADRPIQVYRVSCLQAIFHVVEHFSYHLGQITYITKMLRDVDLEFYDL